MVVYAESGFRTPDADRQQMEQWVSRVEKLNGRSYVRTQVQTSLGLTQLYEWQPGASQAETLVIFPGARTSVLFWDLDKNLDNLQGLRIILVETNGLPNLSDGKTPDIKGLGYGMWAAEVLDQLKLDKVYVAGASFGGLVCMKLAIHQPQRINAAFLLNPGCLQPFSLSLKNLYYNLLPIISPSEKNVRKFLDKGVFCKPTHALSAAAEQLLVDYEVFALTRYKDKTQKPYFMGEELRKVQVNTFLLEGDQDLLFPFAKSVDNAKNLLPQFKGVEVFANVGHGIETYPPALKAIRALIK